MSKMHVFDTGDSYRLECWAGTRKDMAAVVRVCEITPSQTWEEITEAVREHQARHGCGDEASDGGLLTESQRWQAGEARAVLRRWDRERDDPAAALFYDRERVLADQIRTLLEIIESTEAGQ